MARIDKKDIKQRANQIDDAWKDSAAAVEFKGHTQAALAALRAEIASDESEIEDEKAQIRNKENNLIDKYRQLNSMTVDVRSGVAGHKDYGEDSPLYGSMGFVRKSERKSGLTHKTKPEGES
jgi:hypothetical protein